MAAANDKIREFEDAYYTALPEEHRRSRELRDEGMGLLKQGNPSGLDLLDEAVDILGGLEWSEATVPEVVEERERYASLYMYARGHARAGDFTAARAAARTAAAHSPEVPEPLHSLRPVDQYEVIASGRLALVLSTASYFSDPKTFSLARATAARANFVAGLSEDPRVVLFPDRNMTSEERQKARNNHRRLAQFAAVNLSLPASRLRSQVARRLM